MIFISKDGIARDSIDLLNQGLAGNPARLPSLPAQQTQQVNIPPIQPVQAGNTAQPVQPVPAPTAQQPQPQFVGPATAQQFTQPQSQPTLFEQLISQPIFQKGQGTWEERRNAFDVFMNQQVRPVLAGYGVSKEQSESTILQFEDWFNRTYPKPQSDEWGDLGNAVVQGLQSGMGFLSDGTSRLAKLVGADGASQWLRKAGDNWYAAAEKRNDMYSTERQDEMVLAARRSAAAKETDTVIDDIGAAIENFFDAPIDTVANAIGTSAPALTAAVLTTVTGAPSAVVGGAAALLAGTAGVGAANRQGYQANLDFLRQQNVDTNQGWSEEQMQQAALLSTFEGSPEWHDLVGAVSGVVEAVPIGRAVRGVMGTGAARLAADASTGQVLRAGAGALSKDASMNAASGALEQGAANLASIDPNVTFTTDMASAATSEALAGMGMSAGSVMGATRRSPPVLDMEPEQAAEQSVEQPVAPLLLTYDPTSGQTTRLDSADEEQNRAVADMVQHAHHEFGEGVIELSYSGKALDDLLNQYNPANYGTTQGVDGVRYAYFTGNFNGTDTANPTTDSGARLPAFGAGGTGANQAAFNQGASPTSVSYAGFDSENAAFSQQRPVASQNGVAQASGSRNGAVRDWERAYQLDPTNRQATSDTTTGGVRERSAAPATSEPTGSDWQQRTNSPNPTTSTVTITRAQEDQASNPYYGPALPALNPLLQRAQDNGRPVIASRHRERVNELASEGSPLYNDYFSPQNRTNVDPLYSAVTRQIVAEELLNKTGRSIASTVADIRHAQGAKGTAADTLKSQAIRDIADKVITNGGEVSDADAIWFSPHIDDIMSIADDTLRAQVLNAVVTDPSLLGLYNRSGVFSLRGKDADGETTAPIHPTAIGTAKRYLNQINTKGKSADGRTAHVARLMAIDAAEQLFTESGDTALVETMQYLRWVLSQSSRNNKEKAAVKTAENLGRQMLRGVPLTRADAMKMVDALGDGRRVGSGTTAPAQDTVEPHLYGDNQLSTTSESEPTSEELAQARRILQESDEAVQRRRIAETGPFPDEARLAQYREEELTADNRDMGPPVPSEQELAHRRKLGEIEDKKREVERKLGERRLAEKQAAEQKAIEDARKAELEQAQAELEALEQALGPEQKSSGKSKPKVAKAPAKKPVKRLGEKTDTPDDTPPDDTPPKGGKKKSVPAKSDSKSKGKLGTGGKGSKVNAIDTEKAPKQSQSPSRVRTNRAAYEEAKRNGETELTYAQWQQVRTPEFKEWFGDWENDPANASQVVNPRTGEPLVVYHGTNAEFTVFDPKRAGRNGQQYGAGFYFTDNKALADTYRTEGGALQENYLNIRTWLNRDIVTITPEQIKAIIQEVDARNDDTTEDGFLSNFGDVRSDGVESVMDTAVDTLMNNQNDVDLIDEFSTLAGNETAFGAVQAVLGDVGVTATLRDGEVVYAVQGGNQIKSATNNNGEFNPNDNDINRSTAMRPSTGTINSIDDVKAQLPASLHAALDRRVELGNEGKAGGVVLVDTVDELPDHIQVHLSPIDRTQGLYDPTTGMTYLVKEHLNAADAGAVVLHEAVHGAGNTEAENNAMALLDNRHNQPPAVKALLDTVQERMEEAGVDGDPAEAAAYIVEEALMQGRQEGYSAIDGRLMSWVDTVFGKNVGNVIRDFVSRVRNWARQYGYNGEYTVNDLIQLAHSSMKQLARGQAAITDQAPQQSIASTMRRVYDRFVDKPQLPIQTTSQLLREVGGEFQTGDNSPKTKLGGFVYKLRKAFVDAMLPLKSISQEVHAAYERGMSLRGNLMAQIDADHVRPFGRLVTQQVQALQTAARKAPANSPLKRYLNVSPDKLSEMVGYWMTAKQSAEDNITRANAWRKDIAELDAQIMERANTPILRVMAATDINDLTQGQLDAVADLLGIDRTAVEQLTLDEMKRHIKKNWVNNPPYTRSKQAWEAQDDGLKLLTQLREEIRNDLALHEAYDHMVLDEHDLASGQYGDLRPLGGMTTGTAREVLNRFERDPAMAYMRPVIDAVYGIRDATIKMGDEYGVYSDQDRAARLNSRWYVPTTGEGGVVKTDPNAADLQEMMDDVFNSKSYGIGINSKALWRRRQGRKSLPDNAVKAVFDQLYAITNQIGTSAFKNEAAAHAVRDTNATLASRILNGQATRGEVREFLALQRLDIDPANPPDVLILDADSNVPHDTGDIFHMLKVRDENGNTENMQIRLRFPNKDVSQALMKLTTERPNAAIRALSGLSIFQQRMITQVDIMFSLRNLVRDIPERMALLATENLVDTNGKAVKIDFGKDTKTAVARILSNLPFFTKAQREANAIWQFAFNHKFLDTPDGRLLKEFVLSKDGSGLSSRSSTLSAVQNNRSGLFSRYDGVARNTLSKVSDALTSWGEFYETLSAFTAYKALREKNVSHKSAATAVLNTMNFGRKGEFTAWLRPLYFFINPAIQGANNVVAALERDVARYKMYKAQGKRGIHGLHTTSIIMKYAVMAAFAQSVLASMAGGDDSDEEVGNYYDRLDLNRRMREFSIPVGDGEFASIPVPHGLGLIGWGLGMLTREAAMGKLSSEEYTKEVSKLLGKELTGAPLSELSYTDHPIEAFFRTITPSPLQGFVDVATGKNRFGSNVNLRFLSEDKYRHEQGKESTEALYADMAKFLYETTGIDYTPEEVRAVLSSLVPGMLPRLIKGSNELDKNPVKAFVLMSGTQSFYNTGDEHAVEREYYRHRDRALALRRLLDATEPYTGSGKESTTAFMIRARRAGLSEEDIGLLGVISRGDNELRGVRGDDRRVIMKELLRRLPE